MTQLSTIVAIANNRVIGINNTLPWHLPEDLKRFRALTTVIVTRNQDYKVAGALVANSLQDAIAQCKGDDEAFMIGGAELYQDGLKLSDKLYITEIDLDVAGDAHFPDFDRSDWQEIAREAHVSEKGLKFNYVTYQRK